MGSSHFVCSITIISLKYLFHSGAREGITFWFNIWQRNEKENQFTVKRKNNKKKLFLIDALALVIRKQFLYNLFSFDFDALCRHNCAHLWCVRDVMHSEVSYPSS